jgi:uncharacterized protein (TIGR01777 family)
MKILISGASGLIGQELLRDLSQRGHEVVVLQRNSPSTPPYWNIEDKIVDFGREQKIDAVIHLAGENIAAGRWSRERKEAIRNSRIYGTTLLAEYLAKLEEKPRVLISCSAIGFYGHRPDKILNEQSSQGSGFLAEVCGDWEAATAAAEQAGIRAVKIRLGMVLSRNGGALKKMLLPFKLGLGGIIGRGQQLVSWISIDDVVGAINHVLANDQLRGAVNFVSPHPVTNRTLTKTLGHILSRPTVFPLPAVPVKIVLGEMAEELLLSSTKVLPEKLQSSGYQFLYPDLEDVLSTYLLQGGKRSKN